MNKDADSCCDWSSIHLRICEYFQFSKCLGFCRVAASIICFVNVSNDCCISNKIGASVFDEIADKLNGSSADHFFQFCIMLINVFAMLMIRFFCIQTPCCLKKSRNSRNLWFAHNLNCASMQFLQHVWNFTYMRRLWNFRYCHSLKQLFIFSSYMMRIK